MIGRALSHYQITAKLGEGGMGEVFLATDTTLDRQVALKVLPEGLAGDLERLERFEREAKAIAALNHPNIVTIHSVEEADGVKLLTMELVDGKSLDQLLPAAGFELERLLGLAIQIADAVATAHEHGIVHRDLKPANVMVADDGSGSAGRVKVLDFGLAKLAAEDSDEEAETELLTQDGMILGTVPYMSPEQVQAQAVDHRSDIFSIGILLYEMATGTRPFQGANAATVISSILKDQPLPVTEHNADLPNHLGRIVRRCLEKHPQRRYHSARDLQIELEGLQRELSTQSGATHLVSEAAAPRSERSEDSSRMWKAMAILFGLATIVLLANGLREGDSSETRDTAEVSAIELLTDLPGSQQQPSLSPDGTQLLYVAEDEGDFDIFLLRVGGQNAINLTSDFAGRDHQPAWSPDGNRIAFSSDRDGGGIFVMGATGESPLRVSDQGFHPSWSPDGERLLVTGEDIIDPYSRMTSSTLTIVELASGRGEVISVPGDAVEGRWSPDGRLIAYWTSTFGQRDIRVVPSSGSDQFVAITDDEATDWGPVWSPDGRYLYFISDRGGSPDLWRVPVADETGAPDGPLERVTTGVARVVAVSLGDDGRRFAIETKRTAASIEKWAFDPVNERPLSAPEEVLFSSNDLHQMALSGDEQWLAYRSRSPTEDLFVIRIDGSSRRQLTDDAARDRGPSWGPGDEWLVFYSNRGGNYQHWMIRRDGTGLRQIASHSQGLVQAHFSNDGRRMASGFSGAGVLDLSLSGGIYAVDPAWFDPAATVEPVAVEPGFDATPAGWSPDDRYLNAWSLNQGVIQEAVYEVESGKLVFLERADGRPFRISSSTPAWLDKSRLLLWDEEDAMTYVFDVETGATRPVDGLPGPAEFRVADEGRTLYSLRSTRESEIWLLTLDDRVE